MALTYTDFQTYPTDIADINSQYNAKIAAVEAFVVEDMAANGVTVSSAILKYFVFWYLCQSQVTTITAKTGENLPISKNSIPDVSMQVQNWNTGVEKLRALCGITDEEIEASKNSYYGYYPENEIIETLLSSSDVTINENYLSKRSML